MSLLSGRVRHRLHGKVSLTFECGIGGDVRVVGLGEKVRNMLN